MKRLFALLAAGALVATGMGGSAAAAPPVQPAASPQHSTIRATPPAPVTGLTVSQNDLRSLSLSWRNPGQRTANGSRGRSAAHILIRRAVGNQPPTAASDGTLVAVLGAGRTTFTDRHLAPGTTYSYAVFALDRHHNASTPVTVSGTTRTTDSHTGLRGTLTDPDGSPIVGAWVEVRAAGTGNWAGQVTTGHGGTFTLSNLAPGSYTLCFEPIPSTTGASPSGYLAGCYRQQPWGYGDTGTPVTVTAGRITAGITDTLRRSGAIAGRVTDSAGRPVAGVDLSVVSPPPSDFTYNATTAADGTYTLRNLPAADYQICFDTFTASGASATGYVAECYDDQPLEYQGTPIPVTLGTVHSGIDASLATGGAIVAHVADDSGAPADGVRVDLSPNVNFDSIGDQSTDQNGDVRITGIPAGNYGVCFDGAFGSSPSAPYGYVGDCADPQHGSFDLAAGQTVTLSSVVHAAGALGGTVRGTDGPLDGVMVSVLDANGYEVNATDTWNGGTWQLPGLAPGQYTVCYDPSWTSGGYLRGCADGTGTASATGSPVQVSAGQLTTVDATLAQGASIGGTVTDSSGAPIGQVEVSAYPLDGGSYAYYGQTDDSGAYTLSGVTPGRYAVCFDTSNAHGSAPGGYLPECYDNQTDEESADPVTVGDSGTVTVDAALAAGAAISGRVTDETGAPLAGVQVDGNSGSGSSYAYTDQDGAYLLHGLPADQITVCFDPSWATGGGSSTGYVAECYDNQPGSYGGTPVPVTAGQVSTGIDAALAAGAAITGTVRDTTGTGISGVAVSVIGTGSSYFEQDGYSDQYGRYTVTGLPAGSYAACFAYWGWDPNYVPQCYDGAPDVASATPITLAAGDTRGGIDAELATA